MKMFQNMDVLGQSDLSGTVLTTTHQNQVRFLFLSTYLLKPRTEFYGLLRYYLEDLNFYWTDNRRVETLPVKETGQIMIKTGLKQCC
jgi:hypothetical protein